MLATVLIPQGLKFRYKLLDPHRDPDMQQSDGLLLLTRPFGDCLYELLQVGCPSRQPAESNTISYHL